MNAKKANFRALVYAVILVRSAYLLNFDVRYAATLYKCTTKFILMIKIFIHALK